MPKFPRDISGRDLARFLKKYGYEIKRETGSHLRLTSRFRGEEHHITIPDHPYLKIGTLNNILKDISDYLGIEKDILIEELTKK